MKDKISFEVLKDFLKKNEELMKKEYGVKSTGIFGSLVRGEETKSSDIDILLEFEEGRETFRNYMGLKFFLEDAMGRKVDLVIPGTLKPAVKEDILKEAVYV